MKLIVGLGNPGKKYEKTRHNVGFMALDQMIDGFKFDKKFNAEISTDINSELNIKDKIIFAKPQIFMNLSGVSIQFIIAFYKINTEDMIVIHDDLDISFGEFKIQKNRSSAGHNGVQSIIDSLGTKNFIRVRIGIKKVESEKHNINVEKFVLQRFDKNELDVIDEVIKEIIKNILV